MQANSGEKCPRIVEAIIDRTVPLMSESHGQRMEASIVRRSGRRTGGEPAHRHVERTRLVRSQRKHIGWA